MKKTVWAVLAVLFLALPGLALVSPDPPLCRVQARSVPVLHTREGDVFLRRLFVNLRPDCPPGAVAHIVLHNPVTGATDPVNGHRTLTASRPGYLYRGVLPDWGAYWRGRNGALWRVPEGP